MAPGDRARKGAERLVDVTVGAVEEFERHRTKLFGLAYRMLGSAEEAEDVVQDTFLRWHQASTVESPWAWLAKVATNLCVNRLTSARARRESYAGSWLPEPVLTAGGALGPLDSAEQREFVSLAFLVLLERLNPVERAVFVLREAFDYSIGRWPRSSAPPRRTPGSYTPALAGA